MTDQKSKWRNRLLICSTAHCQIGKHDRNASSNTRERKSVCASENQQQCNGDNNRFTTGYRRLMAYIVEYNNNNTLTETLAKQINTTQLARYWMNSVQLNWMNNFQTITKLPEQKKNIHPPVETFNYLRLSAVVSYVFISLKTLLNSFNSISTALVVHE